MDSIQMNDSGPSDDSGYSSSAVFSFITRNIKSAVRGAGHGSACLGFLSGGTGEIRINDRIYNGRPGFVSLLGPEDTVDIIPETEMIFHYIEYSDFYLSETTYFKIPKDEATAFVMLEDDINHFSAMFDVLKKASSMSEENRRDYQRGMLKALLAWFLEVSYRSDHNCSFDDNVQPRMPKRAQRGEKQMGVIRSAVVYVNQHFTDKLSMSDVARIFNMQEQYFCRKFHEITGVSFTDYIRNLRLEYAADLVKQTSYPIKEIYEKCGYSTKSHFMREFKRHYSVSPLNMRKNYVRERIEQEKSEGAISHDNNLNR